MLAPIEEKKDEEHKTTVVEIKTFLNEWIFEHLKGEVLTGPFKGMKLLNEHGWEDGNIGTKILGCYEQELHPAVEEQIEYLNTLGHPIIVNIGCAEGYYAIGLAMRVPKAKVYVVDVEKKCIDILFRNAELNNIKNIFTHENIDEVMTAADFIVCDCEGHEVAYLDIEKWPHLAHVSMLVEIHNFEHQTSTYIINDRFQASHIVWMVNEGGRDPNQFEFMHQWHSTARWMAISEGRPCHMHWFYMKPK